MGASASLPYHILIISQAAHLLIPSLWEWGLQNIHFEETETFSSYTTQCQHFAWAPFLVYMDSAQALMAAGQQGYRADISGLKQHWLCSSDPLVPTGGHSRQQEVDDFGERGSALSSGDKAKAQTKSSLWVVCSTKMPLGTDGNTGHRCCSARKWRLLSWTFPAKFNLIV